MCKFSLKNSAVLRDIGIGTVCRRVKRLFPAKRFGGDSTIVGTWFNNKRTVSNTREIRRQRFSSEVYPDTCTDVRVLSKTCRYRQSVCFFCFSNNRCLIDGNKRKGILRQTESWRHFKTMIIIISFYRALRVLSMGRRTYTANRSDAFISRSRSSIYENRFIYLILFFSPTRPPVPRGRRTTRAFRQQPQVKTPLTRAADRPPTRLFRWFR